MIFDMLLDVEALVGLWLREHDDIIALDARVAGRTPNSLTRPWVRVTMIHATRISRSGLERYIEYVVQCDCYAGDAAMTAHVGQAEATALGNAVRYVLASLSGTTTEDAAVFSANFSTHMRAPDVTMGEPARERVILTAHLTMRPA